MLTCTLQWKVGKTQTEHQPRSRKSSHQTIVHEIEELVYLSLCLREASTDKNENQQKAKNDIHQDTKYFWWSKHQKPPLEVVKKIWSARGL